MSKGLVAEATFCSGGTTWSAALQKAREAAGPKPRGARRIEIAQQAAEGYADKHRDEHGVTNEAGGIMLQLVSIIEELKNDPIHG